MLKIDAFRQEDVQMVAVTEEDRDRVKWMQGICCEKLSCSVLFTS